jgi:hypothetical protein
MKGSLGRSSSVTIASWWKCAWEEGSRPTSALLPALVADVIPIATALKTVEAKKLQVWRKSVPRTEDMCPTPDRSSWRKERFALTQGFSRLGLWQWERPGRASSIMAEGKQRMRNWLGSWCGLQTMPCDFLPPDRRHVPKFPPPPKQGHQLGKKAFKQEPMRDTCSQTKAVQRTGAKGRDLVTQWGHGLPRAPHKRKTASSSSGNPLVGGFYL